MTQQLLNNRYLIIKELGEGGFGNTFLAEDTQMPSGKRCVIKQLKPIANNPQIYQLVQERFQREAAILEQLGDGNEQIPRLYAYFVSAGQFYLVQEWIEGETLSQKVPQQGIMSESAVREMLVSLLSVLDYVHAHRIVHRDIKPENIILRRRDGKPVLIDFGAVKETMGTVVNSQGNTTGSIVVGTPGFMPSEQAAGRPVYASDLYSLGLTAIYALTGKRPQELALDPSTGEILWRQHALSISPGLAAVLDKAIQSHASDRFPSTREMLNALYGSNVATSPIAIPPTMPMTEPTMAVSPRAGAVPYQQPNVGYTPQNFNSNPPRSIQNSGNGSKGMILGSLIIGGLIGASVVIGFILSRNNQSTPQIPVATQSSYPTPSATYSSSPPTPALTRVPIQEPQVPSTPIVRNSPKPVPSQSQLSSPEPTETPEPTPSAKTPSLLNQVIPTYVHSVLSPADVVNPCPGNTKPYLVGETANFDFTVCGANGNPRYYRGKHKVTGREITVSWDGSKFSIGDTIFLPPDYNDTNYPDAALRAYEGNKTVVNEKVISLYKSQ